MNGLKTIKHNFQRWIYNNNIFAFILWTSLIVDAIYLAMFMLISQYILAVVSTFKIVVCISLLNKSDDNGKNSVSQMIAFEVWVYGQMVLYTLFLGVESGFNMILLSMIPTVFFIEYLLRNSSMISYVTSGVICITNIVLISLNDRFAVKDVMNIVWKDIVQSFNWFIAIFLTVFSATIFMAEVFNISNGLEKQNRKLNVLANYDPLTELLLRRENTCFALSSSLLLRASSSLFSARSFSLSTTFFSAICFFSWSIRAFLLARSVLPES